MDNKKYLDKVIGSLVRGTDIDYGNNRIYYPYSTYSTTLPSPTSISFSFIWSSPSPPYVFSDYCEYQFGLTDVEIRCVWDEYKDIIKDKISNQES